MKQIRKVANEMGLRGILTIISIILALASIANTYIWSPAKTVENQIVEPLAKEVGLTSSPCHEGWSLGSAGSGDLRSRYCTKGAWIVWLKPDGSFDHAWNQEDTPFVYDESAVPGW